MSVAMVVVLVIGWLGWMNNADDGPVVMPRPIIKRVTNQTVRVPGTTITVAPAAGWSLLSIENYENEVPTFVNHSTQTVATFERLGGQPDAPDVSSGATEIEYKNVAIVWLTHEQIGGASMIDGWIQRVTPLARLRVLTRAKGIADDSSITSLCDAIQVDESP